MKAAAATAKVEFSKDDIGTGTGTTSSSTTTTTTTTKSSSFSIIWWTLKTICLDIPLLVVIMITAMTLLAQTFYEGPMQTLIESYRRSGQVDYYGYYTDFLPDITYYGRQCDHRDVTTNDSNDLIVPSGATPEQASHIMMKHGAVLLQQLLTNQTAYQLREYLETRHDIKDQLPWDEKFWGDIGRLSLGLGAEDHPIIAQALQEVTNHPTLQATLEGIVGPDPSIVEISTLTTLHGAKDQGIHTDSDFFGSSLLYSRTFLHSYTLFMALQDTTSKMGATTVCPGTQWCANEDLSDVCHANGAFEVSSNGQTGREVGLLYRGDGMMFNQNIWHRGPKNLDYNFPMNRVMFILTFVSRHALEQGDVRQQGLGTYYYQRWNMWGHTLQDLQQAATRMAQPAVRSLKALGLWKVNYHNNNNNDDDNTTHWGIPWLEHFARQLANREDFFDDYELIDFQNYLRKMGVMEWLPDIEPVESSSRRLRKESEDDLLWEPYLKKVARALSNFVQEKYQIALGVYLFIHGLTMGIAALRGQSLEIGRVLQRLILLHLIVGLLSAGIWEFVTNHSYLGQRIQMRDSWRDPFPTPPTMNHLTKTTYPNRNDVLIGTRFDAPYLSSFNHVLDYHPGNEYLANAIATLPSSDVSTTHSVSAALQWLQVYLAQPVDGVVPRFLKQDYQTGFWTLLNPEEVTGVLYQKVVLAKSVLLSHLDSHLKTELADARFGLQRETVMARQRADLIQALHSTLIPSLDVQSRNTVTKTPSQSTGSNLFPSKTKRVETISSTVPNRTCRTTSFLLLFGGPNGKTLQLKVGDHFSAPYFDTEEYWEAEVDEVLSENRVHILYQNPGEMGSSDTLDLSDESMPPIRPFQHFVQGQKVEVVSLEGEWLPATLDLVHPLGHVTVRYPDGNLEALIPLTALRHYDSHESMQQSIRIVGWTTQENDYEEDGDSPFELGQQVFANFRGAGDWFPARVDGINDDGTFAIAYDDGDYEHALSAELIQPMKY